MPVVGLDDTDSRERGMCTTFVAARIGERLTDAGCEVKRHLLVRCNPAVEHKTRGNAALALHVGPSGNDEPGDDAPGDDSPAGGLEASRIEACFDVAHDAIEELAETTGGDANPGLVVAPGRPEEVPADVATFADTAVRGHHSIEDAVTLANRRGYRHANWGNGRGRIGALAAIGAWRAGDEWTYERIAYRERTRWGSERDVDSDSVFAAADGRRPDVWDTVDRESGTAVCVPRTPCPVLYGVRGDDPDSVETVAAAIDGEPVDRAVTFVTNQGTDAHLQRGAIDEVVEGRSYRVDGVVASEPETRRGGHVFVDVEAAAADNGRLRCVAFEPTKRFRDHVRALRPGDAVTVCGEVSEGTLKLEKFAVRELVRTELGTPECPDCGRRMESAGADQGYRCRDCGTAAPGQTERRIERELAEGWYEVPPIARRHVAKPLVRGGFDAPVHPER